jgi:hypothetical protein
MRYALASTGGNSLVTFRENLLAISSRVKNPKYSWILDKKVFLNVRKESTLSTDQQLRRVKCSNIIFITILQSF